MIYLSLLLVLFTRSCVVVRTKPAINNIRDELWVCPDVTLSIERDIKLKTLTLIYPSHRRLSDIAFYFFAVDFST